MSQRVAEGVEGRLTLPSNSRGVPPVVATGEPVRVKNHCLAKSINDAGWYQFLLWLEYFGKVFKRITVAVDPAYTSQECSSCGVKVKKSLSTRTHVCQCGCRLDRDENAAVTILKRGIATVGHTVRSVLDTENAWGEVTTTEVGVILPQQVAS